MNYLKIFSKYCYSTMQATSPFTQETLALVNKTMGNLEKFKTAKVITTSIVLTTNPNNLDDLRIIKKVPGCPNPSEDYFLFTFLRAYCKSLLNTGLTIRMEKDFIDDSPPDYGKYKDVERYFYYGEKALEAPENEENRPPKPVLVMTKKTKTEDLYNVPLYRCKSYLHLVESTPELSIEIENDPKFREFEKKHNIAIVPDKIVDLSDGLDYLLNKRKYESVLVEAGATLIGPYLEDPKIESPFDFIVLSVFSGKIEKEWIGVPYPNMNKLKLKHDIVYESPKFPHKEGDLTVYVLENKKRLKH